MAKVNVTYNAPEGDNPVVITGGKRFFDGLPVELDEFEHATLLGKLRTNQHFSVDSVNAGVPASTTGQTWGNQ